MRLVIQRVKNANVAVNQKIVGSIDQGLLVYLGISVESSIMDIPKYVKKLVNLRIFSDENDKLNLNIKDINGKILLISQFTLYGDVKKGNRPSFTKALGGEFANGFYNEFIKELKTLINVETGIFGADMQVKSINDGPVTIIMENL